MILNTIDWVILFGFLLISLGIGFWTSRKNKSASEFFAAGGKMPWWLLGVSMVATTFSTDTPNLVTDIVRQNGVSGNWAWWAFLLTGMLTVFVYAGLWKKSGVLTDVEFYELRYSGKAARFLRGFRAIYLGFLFNVMIMASVSLAAIKIGGVLLGLSPVETVVIAGVITVIYSSLGGLRGVLFTDFLQFFLSLGGAFVAAYVALNHPKVGGLDNLLVHENVVDKLSFFPSFSNPEMWVMLLIIPLLVQWWSTWYPGAEPGGGGYIAQRMFAAKNADHSIKAVLFFNVAHYAIRPWPWIIVALCSIIVFPDLDSFAKAFPAVNSGVATHDMGYPAMLTFIPAGLLGLVVTSLVAAYMSTISTHLNWGSSYLVNDVYKRFINPTASEGKQVLLGRLLTVVLMIFSMLMALVLENALQTFEILLQIGAGTGLIFILRWFWWRVNAISEIVAMVVSFLIALYFAFATHPFGFEELLSWQKLIIGVSITTISWVTASFLTQKTADEQLANFLNKVNPGGPGWKKIIARLSTKGLIQHKAQKWKVPTGIICMIAGSMGVYGLLFSTGLFIYGELLEASGLLLFSVFCGYVIFKLYPKIIAED
ncbi:sodium/glucose cotransporter [Marivirga tractuosa]|uniref:Na+/solute symporter n=1 Tax=Marivirga tractuosa (strain ATCC 23168 / DSM 4126 / NBRC 15989 / NCIMB 1408 / VKM B-1430 / H-43) TaxID=643867 RepID=E4TQ45_MARTH|nr:sodium:solute symporter family protein [Marivirga tractuosa]ADR21591.1 Na+/solute symporter [Marivirga tractuosa DSM 4126]BDD13953.1 sodium/glucose cotransporter [Marivirga tractuosa]